MNRFPVLFAVTLMVGCSHGPVLSPEISDTGSKSVHGGIVYSIPSENPVMKMKLVSLGLNDKKMLHVRMYFHRLGTSSGEYIDPQEQVLVFPDSTAEIHPAKVHAYAKQKPIVSLVDPQKQVVELLFPLPAGGSQYTHVDLRWKVHYAQDGKPRVMSKTERYDYVSNYSQRGVGNYYGSLEFPDDEPWIFPYDPNWVGEGWIWW